MLKYEARQLYLEDEGLYCLPIPKLNQAQLRFISAELMADGYAVSAGTRLVARRAESRLTIVASGLAWSSAEVLDAVAPPLMRALDLGKEDTDSNPYFTVRRGSGCFEIQLLPRLESLGRWTSLRRQDSCGLTPDEALVLARLLSRSTERIECVTDYPSDESFLMQRGRHLYFRSRLTVGEFLSNLRTISGRRRRSSYIPRSSVFRVQGEPPTIDDELSMELGEWCCLDVATKTSKPRP